MPNNSQDLISLLIEKRKKLQLTQNKLSKKLDVSHTTITRIENGEMNPTISLFISIANELGYDLTLQKFDKNQINLENLKDIKTIEEELIEENFKKNIKAPKEELKLLINKLGYKIIDNNIFGKDVLVLKKNNRR